MPESSLPKYDFSAQSGSRTCVVFSVLLLQVQLILEQKD